jgi:MFS family permease
MASTAAADGAALPRRGEMRTVSLVSAAHLISHFHQLVLPPLFSFLKAQLGIGFVELGLALTLFSIVSVVAQLPIGFIVDRVGSRRLLIAGLVIGGLALIAFALAPSYPALLLTAALLGIANGVYHPADYAILSARIAPARIGRAYSVHTFSGFLGSALAPIAMIAIAKTLGLSAALFAAGAIAIVVAAVLVPARGLDGEAATAPARPAATPRDGGGVRALMTPAILGLTAFFALLSLSTSGISNFSVVALQNAYGTPLTVANVALTAFMAATAFGVLAGGFVADLTRRHAEVAAAGFAVNALIVLLIGTVGLGAVALVAAMAAAGFLSGLIMPSRDMLVRAASPPDAIGRTFGIVTTGFSIGGTIGPMLFGWIMDRGAPHWVFGASVVFMAITAASALIGDRRAHAAPTREAA